MPKKTVAPMLALAVVLAGCSEAVNEPESTFTASGRILDVDGQPWAGGEAGIKKYNLLEIAFTAGLILFDLDPDKTATTDAEGGYAFEYLGKETHITGVPSQFKVGTMGLEYGATTSFFTLANGSRELKPLRLWNGITAPAEGGPTLQTGADLTVSWEAAPDPSDDPRRGYRVTVEQSMLPRALVWVEEEAAGAGSVSIPQRALPASGKSYTARVTAWYESGNRSYAEARGFTSDYADGTLEIAAATASEGDSTAFKAFDGDYRSSWHSLVPGPEEGLEREITLTLDLGALRTVSSAVIHGAAGATNTMVVETSEDGETFTEAGSYAFEENARWIVHDFVAPVLARYLRLRFTTTRNYNSVQEVRLFGT